MINKYKLEWPFESNYTDGVRSDEDKEDSHYVKVNRSPVILKYHVWVSSHEHDQVHLLSLVWNSNHVLGGQDFQQ